MHIGTAFILFIIIAGGITLASSGCADPWIIKSDSGGVGFIGCSIDTISEWGDSVVSDGYVSTISEILRNALGNLLSYYDHYAS